MVVDLLSSLFPFHLIWQYSSKGSIATFPQPEVRSYFQRSQIEVTFVSKSATSKWLVFQNTPCVFWWLVFQTTLCVFWWLVFQTTLCVFGGHYPGAGRPLPAVQVFTPAQSPPDLIQHFSVTMVTHWADSEKTRPLTFRPQGSDFSSGCHIQGAPRPRVGVSCHLYPSDTLNIWGVLRPETQVTSRSDLALWKYPGMWVSWCALVHWIFFPIFMQWQIGKMMANRFSCYMIKMKYILQVL